jgi:hypothetical protein
MVHFFGLALSMTSMAATQLVRTESAGKLRHFFYGLKTSVVLRVS